MATAAIITVVEPKGCKTPTVTQSISNPSAMTVRRHSSPDIYPDSASRLFALLPSPRSGTSVLINLGITKYRTNDMKRDQGAAYKSHDPQVTCPQNSDA